MAYGLTEKQRNAMIAVQLWFDEQGHTPTRIELATTLGIRNKSGASRLVDMLVERGYLRRERAGRIEIVERINVEPEFVGFFDPTAVQLAELALMGE